MKGVQCYELFGGIALMNHAFSFPFTVAVRLLSDLKLLILWKNKVKIFPIS